MSHGEETQHPETNASEANENGETGQAEEKSKPIERLRARRDPWHHLRDYLQQTGGIQVTITLDPESRRIIERFTDSIEHGVTDLCDAAEDEAAAARLVKSETSRLREMVAIGRRADSTPAVDLDRHRFARAVLRRVARVCGIGGGDGS